MGIGKRSFCDGEGIKFDLEKRKEKVMERNSILLSDVKGSELEKMSFDEIVKVFGKDVVKSGFVSRYKMSERSKEMREDKVNEVNRLKKEIEELKEMMKGKMNK